MKFVKAEDNDKECIYERMVSENGLVEIGIYPVAFGNRVRAGFVGDTGCAIDYCGGDNQELIENLYSAALSILSKREENKSCFKGIVSHSDIKPYFNDPKFVKWLNDEAGEYDHIKIAPIKEIRKRMFDNNPDYSDFMAMLK